MATRIDPFRELDRMASQLLSGRGLRQMPMDLYKDGEKYVVEADLPGVDPSSVDIDVDGQLLTIRAERKVSTAEREGTQWITRERETGSYVRQLNLGQDVDMESISADYNSGVLKVTIPVSPSPSRARSRSTWAGALRPSRPSPPPAPALPGSPPRTAATPRPRWTPTSDLQRF